MPRYTINDVADPPQKKKYTVADVAEPSPTPEAKWSDVPANAVKDVKSMVEGAKGGAEFLSQDAADLPGYLNDTPIKQIGKDVLSSAEKGAEFINRIPQTILDRVDELMTRPVQSFKEHPVNTAVDVGSVVFPALKELGVTEGVTNAARGVAQEAGSRALGFSKGVMRKLNMVPADARQVAQTMLDNGTIKAFRTTEDLLSGTEDLKRSVGKNIGDFLESRNYSFDARKAIDEIESLRPEFKGGAYDVEHAKIDRAIATIKAHKKDLMNFDEANDLKGTLQGLANYASNKDATILDKQIAAKFRSAVDDALENPRKLTPQQIRRGEVQAVPEDAQEFLSNKKVYGATKKAETALEDKVRMAGNRKLGLTDFILAGGGVAEGALGNPIIALKTALAIAAKKGIEKYGWSTTSAFANGLASVAGRYAPVLLSAASKGSQALTAAHTMLYDKSPGYRDHIDSFMGKPPQAMAVAQGYDDARNQSGAYAQELAAARRAVSSGKVSPQEADARLKKAFGKGFQ